MRFRLTVWFLLVATGCSVNCLSKMAGNHDGASAAVARNGNPKTLDCNDPDGYSLVVVTDPERESKNLGTVPRVLNVAVGGDIKAAIKMPTDSDAQNFMGSTEKTKEGFDITVEYGTRYYYRKQFKFVCKEGDFYLYKVRVESFDKFDPESRENWDRREIEVNPNLPIRKFSIFDNLAN